MPALPLPHLCHSGPFTTTCLPPFSHTYLPVSLQKHLATTYHHIFCLTCLCETRRPFFCLFLFLPTPDFVPYLSVTFNFCASFPSTTYLSLTPHLPEEEDGGQDGEPSYTDSPHTPACTLCRWKSLTTCHTTFSAPAGAYRTTPPTCCVPAADMHGFYVAVLPGLGKEVSLLHHHHLPFPLPHSGSTCRWFATHVCLYTPPATMLLSAPFTSLLPPAPPRYCVTCYSLFFSCCGPFIEGTGSFFIFWFIFCRSLHACTFTYCVLGWSDVVHTRGERARGGILPVFRRQFYYLFCRRYDTYSLLVPLVCTHFSHLPLR